MPGTGSSQRAFGEERATRSSDKETAGGFTSWMHGADAPIRTKKEQGRGQAAVLCLPGGQDPVDQGVEMAARDVPVRLSSLCSKGRNYLRQWRSPWGDD